MAIQNIKYFLKMIGLVLFIVNYVFLTYLEPEIATPPLDGLILPGVTRDSILALTKTWVSDCCIIVKC